MLKKLAFVTLTLIAVLWQSYFIYALLHGAAESFRQTWQSFGVRQSAYSEFVFSTAAYWSVLPALSALASAHALIRDGFRRYVFASLLAVGGCVALAWSAYAPSLMISL